MYIINRVSIKNFKGIRSKTDFILNNSVYLIGPNNAGKSTLLVALLCFFNEEKFLANYANRTEYRSRYEGYNRSEIELEFNSDLISSKSIKERIIKKYGKRLIIKKVYVISDTSQIISIEYFISGKKKSDFALDVDITKFLEAFHISYIHPQQAEELLQTAQIKLKERVITNFGRYSTVSHTFNQLKQSWSDMREVANESISKMLSQELQSMWPGCEVQISLPSSIEEIIKVSDIGFKTNSNNQLIEITSHGTGAQSTILYQTHFILDSDRSLHRGMYYPIWLVEEPESFLHTDICMKLGALLSSDPWLANIQFFITTHNSYILGTANQNNEKANVIILNNNKIEKSVLFSQLCDDDLMKIGEILGDDSFKLLFEIVSGDINLYLEDSRELTAVKFKEIGFQNVKSLTGSGLIKKYIEVLSLLSDQIPKKNYFLVDTDKGFTQIETIIKNRPQKVLGTSGIYTYTITRNVEVLCLPDELAVENLFNEFDVFLTSTVNKLFDQKKNYRTAISDSIPAEFSRTHAEIRNVKNDKGLEGAKIRICKTQDIKDQFWLQVENSKYSIAKNYQIDLKKLLKR